MKTNRRDFLKLTTAGAAFAALPRELRAGEAENVPAFARGAKILPPILSNVEIVRSAAVAQGKAASFFIDDAIWFLRDLTRRRPKALFDDPFLSVLKECHDRYGLKVQINLFYRTDFFYGMDEFTLAEVTDAYKAEWQANKDWLKLGFHSLQEFPDYPWINADYADVKRLFTMTKREVERFAGEGVLTAALVPHWCPMSKEGVRALRDCGVRLMECSVGPRYAYDGRRERLPYGHGFRLEQNRKPETGFFWRDTRNADIAASICSYNHISPEQYARTALSFDFVRDAETGMNFKHMFCEAPCLNLCTPETLRSDTAKILDRDYLIFSDHEQYFYKDYLAYQPDYAEKIRIMSQMVAESGRRFILMEELI